MRVNQRAKSIRITIRNGRHIFLFKPESVSLNDAINFIYTKIHWVEKPRKKISKQKLLRLNLSSAKSKRFWDETEQKAFHFF